MREELVYQEKTHLLVLNHGMDNIIGLKNTEAGHSKYYRGLLNMSVGVCIWKLDLTPGSLGNPKNTFFWE